ncbi:hypothetical protein SE91_32220 [Bradyrhizobium sp. DOA1]|nr:hypothetical protein SE91_32220 [Bradyrhizobium sp. DOA1]
MEKFLANSPRPDCPGIHVLSAASKVVDGWDEPGDDAPEVISSLSMVESGRPQFPATCLNPQGNMPILLIKGCRSRALMHQSRFERTL